MDIAIDEVVYFDCVTHHPSTGAVTDADSTPTFEVFEESTDTDIGVGGNLTKRTSKTGDYRGSFTASAANGFEAGKWYSVIASATVNSIAGKARVLHFRAVPAESSAGVPKVDTSHLSGQSQTARDIGASVLLSVGTGAGQLNVSGGKAPATIAAGDIANSAITANSIASDAIAAAKIATGAITNAKFASGAIDAAVIANGAIDAATFAADVDAEILSYLVDDSTRIDASALNTLSSHDPGEAIMGTTDLGTGSGLTSLATAAELAKVPKSDGTATWNATAAAQIQSEANDALVANHLDHLLATTYDPASKPGAADALLNELIENDGGVSRYTANALEQAPTGGSAPTAEEIADEVETRELQLTSAYDAAKAAAQASKMLAYFQLSLRTDVAIGTDRATELGEINANQGSGAGGFLNTTDSQENTRNAVETLVARLTAARAGYLDNINNAGLQTTVAQTGDAYAIVSSGTHGNAALKTLIDAIQADLPTRITKNTALSAFPFTMVEDGDHVTGATGLTVTATRSLDGGAFGACANAVSEVSNGVYKIDLAAGDLNGNTVVLKFTATGADARLIHIVTQPT